MLSCYRLSEGFGTPLVELIQGDWEVFSDRLMRRGKAGCLLDQILDAGWDDDDGEPRISASDHFDRHGWSNTTLVDIWREFTAAVQQDPACPLTLRGAEFDEFSFREDLCGRRGVKLPAGTVLYRARLGFEAGSGPPTPFTGPAMHAPPRDQARAGRANPAGRIVLYCAGQRHTAIAEMRPALGEYVSVAELPVRKEVEVLDLTSDPDAINPFVEESLQYWMEFAELLSAFAEQLAKPLRSRDRLEDYLPTQKLAEAIEKAGLAGIRYPSAMAPGGTNVVLFDPAVAEVGASSLVEIVDTRIEYEDVTEQKSMVCPI